MTTVPARTDNYHRFELVHLGNNAGKNSWSAVAYGEELPRAGIFSYGINQWDALANAAIGAANYVYRESMKNKKSFPPASAKIVQVEKVSRKRKGKSAS